MNKALLFASLKKGCVAGAMAAIGGVVWLWLTGETENFILPVIAGIAICYAATMLLYFQGREG